MREWIALSPLPPCAPPHPRCPRPSPAPTTASPRAAAPLPRGGARPATRPRARAATRPPVAPAATRRASRDRASSSPRRARGRGRRRRRPGAPRPARALRLGFGRRATDDASKPRDASAVADDAPEAPPALVGVAFFDLDHTIIDTNSNKHWVQREILAGRVTPKLILTAIYWFTRYAMGQGAGAEAAGAEAAMAYAGKSERVLRREVKNLFDEKLAHRVRPGYLAVLEAHREDGVRCIMCTSSWQYAARYAAKLFGCETDPSQIVSSRMRVDEGTGRLTGEIAAVAYGDGKYRETKKWADENGVDLALSHFYSDSMSDVLLLEMVGHPVVVNPDPRLRKHAEERNWPIVDWGESEAGGGKKR